MNRVSLFNFFLNHIHPAGPRTHHTLSFCLGLSPTLFTLPGLFYSLLFKWVAPSKTKTAPDFLHDIKQLLYDFSKLKRKRQKQKGYAFHLCLCKQTQ